MRFMQIKNALFIILICIPHLKVFSQLSEQQHFSISKYLDIFNSVFNKINLYYIDTLNVKKIIQNNITYTLQQLDPYNEYIPTENLPDFQFQITGKYSGIGAVISTKNNKIIILETYEGMPATLAGLLPGDEILSINKKSTHAKTMLFVSEQLKGEPNTKVKIKYKRLNFQQPKEITIKRKYININPVPYYGLIKNGIGYICLSSFTTKSALIVKEALIDLKKKYQIKSLIFDVRNNRGGTVYDCLEMLNLFIQKNKLLLSMKGKSKQMNKIFYATQFPLDRKIPLAILINKNSASASEIFSGTIQDTDRGILVGTRTYGKGLVQSTFQLPYNDLLKLTTAKYYIPSGRCIQITDFFHKKEEKKSLQISDKHTNIFYTDHNRPVSEGNGILPDFIVEDEKIPAIVHYLEKHFILFDFAVKWKSKHPKIISPLKFTLSDIIYNEFKEFVKTNTKQNLDYNQKSKKMMDSLKEIMKFEGYYNNAALEIKALENKLKPNLDRDLNFYKSQISKYLAMHIIKQYYFTKGLLIYQLRNDFVLNKAIKILQNDELYNATLNIN